MVDTKGNPRVFVYGSLKRGEALNVILNKANAVFVGLDKIKHEGWMADMGAFPALVSESGSTKTIFGEVWAVDEDGLAALDYTEGHPTFFERQKTVSEHLGMRVWVYTLTPEAAEYVGSDDQISAGIWRAKSSEVEFWNEHGEELVCEV